MFRLTDTLMFYERGLCCCLNHNYNLISAHNWGSSERRDWGVFRDVPNGLRERERERERASERERSGSSIAADW